ncbi:MAG: DNA cytosine methyltransferase [Chloroflexi bacterium]|nr:DNA cytosine methyltransferase [Chloroflexota bacterium]
MVGGDEREVAAVTPHPSQRAAWVRDMHSLLERKASVGLKALDLFCGAGGLSLGFWASGFDVEGIDHSPDAVSTYASNFSHATCADVDADSELPSADVVVAGPPCQPWSRAGKRLGERDERDGFMTTLRAVERVQPAAVVIENVPDLARASGRSHLDDFKGRLRALGFAVAEHELNSADYGVPQNRRRIFITGIRDDRPLDRPAPGG